MKLSVIIITQDAGATLRRGRESVKWADEIVVHAPFGLAPLLGLVLAIALGSLFNSLRLDHTEGLLFAWPAGRARAARRACARPVA